MDVTPADTADDAVDSDWGCSAVARVVGDAQLLMRIFVELVCA